MSDMTTIQIFGFKKCQATRKAERFFKERRIPFQRIALEEKGFAKGELQSVAAAVGGHEAMLDTGSKRYETLGLKYVKRDLEKTILEHPDVVRTPVVRNGRLATVGVAEDVWKGWLAG